MAKAQQFVTRLGEIKTELEKLGDDFVDHFPRSSSLYKFVDEIGLAQQGLGALHDEMARAVQTADSEDKIKRDLLAQMEESDLYKFLKPEGRNRLAEYLVQQGAPLASAEDLLAFAVKSIGGLDAEHIVKNLSKEFVMQLGGQAPPGEMGQPEGENDNKFDAYKAGVDHIKETLNDAEQKDTFIGTLAREYLKREPELAIRKFYSKVSL